MCTVRTHIESLQELILYERQLLHRLSLELVQKKSELTTKLLSFGEQVATVNQIAFLGRQINELRRILNRHEEALHRLHQ